MAEVEKVEEEPLTRGAFPSFAKKYGLLPKLGINPDQRLRITLKEPDTARQGLVTALN